MRRISAATLVIAALLAATAHAQDALGDVWRETGFDRIAVQSAGLERSLATHARDSLRNITVSRQTRDDDQVTLALAFALRPGLLADRWLIPIEGDVLLPALEEAGVEVNHRVIRLRDCLTFDSDTGQITGEGPAMAVARMGASTHAEDTPEFKTAIRLLSRISAAHEAASSFTVIPDPHDPEGAWHTPDGAARIGIPGAEEIAAQFAALSQAVTDADADAARSLAAELAEDLPALPNYTSETRLSLDHTYTTKRPYFWASFAYVISAALFFVSQVTRSNRWWWSAMIVMGLGLAAHILGAAIRGYLLGRMPLSNLYEATTTGLVFVILIAMILEAIYRMRVVGLSSAFLSFIYYRWLLSSDAFGNDAIEPLRAVLNSAWLDYHVTCMMLSYGAFTIAFAMAILYVLRAALPRLMSWAPTLDDLDLYIYRSIQFGWPLLGIGIVLGAIWADTAWGRMWSWDPKETWSLITWLIYTAFLHVRLVHGWRGTIMAWASLVGYAAVIFTYIGVNFVLSGLHSYAG